MQQEAVQYVNYSDYKNINGVEVQWPLEIPEDIAQDVIDFVTRNMKASEINSHVNNNLNIFFNNLKLILIYPPPPGAPLTI